MRGGVRAVGDKKGRESGEFRRSRVEVEVESDLRLRKEREKDSEGQAPRKRLKGSNLCVERCAIKSNAICSIINCCWLFGSLEVEDDLDDSM